jgi:hypothetical protein
LFTLVSCGGQNFLPAKVRDADVFHVVTYEQVPLPVEFPGCPKLPFRVDPREDLRFLRARDGRDAARNKFTDLRGKLLRSPCYH